MKEVSLRISDSCETIEEAFSFYVFDTTQFNHFSKFKNINIHPEIGWLQEVLNLKLRELSNIAFHILPIASSEMSIERYFSQQKLILSELRIKSKDDLTNARFYLAD